MKVMLVQPPYDNGISIGCMPHYSEEARSPLPPLGLLYLAGHLKKKHDTMVLDMGLPTVTSMDLQKAIERFCPDLIGISVVIGLWPNAVNILRTIKSKYPWILTVVGGPNPTQYPQETLGFEDIDFVITGFGQAPLMELCDRIEVGKPWNGIENCYSRFGQQTNYTTVYGNRLSEFDLPDRGASPFRQYYVGFCPENPTTTMISSVGCPFRCAFCNVNQQQVEYFSAFRVVKEMESICDLGIKSILFNDELFTLQHSRVETICEELIERRINIHWSVKSRIDLVNTRVLEMMKDAGCFNIHFGIESGNDSTLERMRKGYNTEQVRKTIRIVKDAGLCCTGNFMLAYPGETKGDVLNTISFAESLGLDISQFSITLYIPETELFREAFHDDHWSQFTRYPERPDLIQRFASDMSTDDLLELLSIAHQRTKTLYDMPVIQEKRQAAYA